MQQDYHTLERNLTDIESMDMDGQIQIEIQKPELFELQVQIMNQAGHDSTRLYQQQPVDIQDSEFEIQNMISNQNISGISPRMFGDENGLDDNSRARLNFRANSFLDSNGVPLLDLHKYPSHIEPSQLKGIDMGNDKEIFKNKLSKTMRNFVQKSCRICLGEENETDNELISPCKCAGTMKFIHLQCLQEWINGKKSIRELPFSTIYLFRISQCELCKCTFPGKIFCLKNLDYIRDYNKKIEIFKLNRPTDGHFMVLEVVGMPTGKTFQVIKLSERHTLKIVLIPILKINQGRGHDSDIRVADISVSRCHSLLKLDLESNSVILQDYHSKFGTLLLLKQPYELKPEHDLVIQTGKTMFTINLSQIQKSLSQKMQFHSLISSCRCSCIFPKSKNKTRIQNLQVDFEYFMCHELFPKDLHKYRRLLYGDKLVKLFNNNSYAIKHPTKQNDEGLEEENNNFFTDGIELGQNHGTVFSQNKNSFRNSQKHVNKVNQIMPFQVAADHKTVNQYLSNGPVTRSILINEQIQDDITQRNQSDQLIGHQISSQRHEILSPENSNFKSNGLKSQTPHSVIVQEEIKEEEEEKLMDEICKEHEESEARQSGEKPKKLSLHNMSGRNTQEELHGKTSQRQSIQRLLNNP